MRDRGLRSNGWHGQRYSDARASANAEAARACEYACPCHPEFKINGHFRILLSTMLLLSGGCIGNRPANPATTQPVTMVEPELAEKEYWLAKPATAEVRGGFEPLWQACEDTAHEYLFRIDRRQKRGGLLTTEPIITRQWWEFWRKDAGTFRDTQEATIASIRRTIFFQFRKDGDSSFIVTPKVLVEKEAKVDPKYKEDIEGPATYWFALRRDEVMEKKVAKSIREHL